MSDNDAKPKPGGRRPSRPKSRDLVPVTKPEGRPGEIIAGVDTMVDETEPRDDEPYSRTN